MNTKFINALFDAIDDPTYCPIVICTQSLEAEEYVQKKLNNSRSMDMKLSEFMEVYFEDKQNELKERTMKNKRYMMEQHIIPYFGNQMMSEISAGQIIQWQNEMQTGALSRKSTS